MLGWSSKLRRNFGRRGGFVYVVGFWGFDKVKEEIAGSWGYCGDKERED